MLCAFPVDTAAASAASASSAATSKLSGLNPSLDESLFLSARLCPVGDVEEEGFELPVTKVEAPAPAPVHVGRARQGSERVDVDLREAPATGSWLRMPHMRGLEVGAKSSRQADMCMRSQPKE